MIRALLLKMSRSRRLARWVIGNAATRRAARRFVAGENLEDALAAARALNQAGLMATLDLLGENVSSEAHARRACQAYLEMFDCIAQERLDANVSLKLTQLGLGLDDALCRELVESIVARAAGYGNFVRIDMEGAGYTERTIELCKRMREKSPAVGAVIQSYLYRSAQDVEDLLGLGCSIRLVKGAYREPPDIAFQKKAGVDANFIRLMQRLLSSGVYHGIATHDEDLIDATVAFAVKNGIGKGRFELQMLYGIRADLQQQLVREGYRVRVYIPFGSDWFPYLTRRLAERPANLVFFLRHFFRGN